MTAPDYLEDYVDVAERIRLLYQQHPQAQIRSGEPRIVNIGDRLFIMQDAEVFTDPTQLRGTRAWATEPFPGRTAYTRDSEQMNCETSAVGRAIALMGIGTRRSVASLQEVRNRQPEPDKSTDFKPPGHVSKARERRIARLKRALSKHSDTDEGRRMIVETITKRSVAGWNELTPHDLNTLETIFADLDEGRLVLDWADNTPRIFEVNPE